ncbi:MAG: hypothetical protein Q9198_005653, partial [Flavoplaca austrocitrina]
MPVALTPTTDGARTPISRLEHSIRVPDQEEDARLQIKTILADVLKLDLDDLDEEKSFLSLGGDSLLAIKVMARCKLKGIALDVVDAIQANSIADLYHRVCRGPALNGNAVGGGDTAPLSLDRSSELSTLQRIYAAAGDTEARIFRLSPTTSENDLHVALSHLVEKHDMLRSRLHRNIDGQWHRQILPITKDSFIFEMRGIEVDTEIADRVAILRTRLGRSGEPVFGAIFFEMTSGAGMLALLAHRAVVDSTSWLLVASELISHPRIGQGLTLHSALAQEWAFSGYAEQEDGQANGITPSGDNPGDGIFSTPQREKSATGQVVISKNDTAILLDQLSANSDHFEPLDIIHSALATAACTTTSNQTEETLCYDVYENRFNESSFDRKNAVGCFDQASSFRTQSFPSQEDERLLRRLKDCTRHTPGPPEDEAESQQDPNNFTPTSITDANVIVLDVRRLKHQISGSEVPVAPVSQDSISDAWAEEMNLKDSSSLFVSLCSTNGEIMCSFLGNSRWQAHHNFHDFMSVFKASVSGVLSRLRRIPTLAVLHDPLIVAPTCTGLEALDPDTLQ